MVTPRDPDDDFFDEPPSPPRPLSRKRKRTDTAVAARRPEQRKAAAVQQIVHYLEGTQARFFDDGQHTDIDIVIRNYRVSVQQRSAVDNGSCMIFTVHFRTDLSVRHIDVSSLKHLQGRNCSLGGKELISWIQDAADRFRFSIQLLDASYYRLKNGSIYCLWIFCVLQNNLTWYQRRGFGFNDPKPWIQSSNNEFRNAPLSFFREQNFDEHLAPLVAQLYVQDKKYMFSFCSNDRKKFESHAQFVAYVYDRWYRVAELDDHIDWLLREFAEFNENTPITLLFTNARFMSMHSEVAYWVESIFVHVIALPDLNMVYQPAILTGT